MSLKTLVSLLCILACMAGTFVQVSYLSNEYFHYPTKTKVMVDFPKFIEPPDYSFCSRVSDLVDPIQTARLLHVNTNTTSNAAREKLRGAVFTGLTLKQMFDLAPQSNHILDACGLRFPGSYVTSLFGKQNCPQHFSIGRYYMQEFLCYKISPNQQISKLAYDFEKVSQADTGKGRIYEFNLNRTALGRSAYITHIVHKNDPIVSRYYSQLLTQKFSPQSRLSTPTEFKLVFSIFTYALLPFPYDTNCGHNSRTWHCTQACVTENTLSNFNKLPFNWIIHENSSIILMDINLDRHLLTHTDMANTNIWRKLKSIEDECSRRCKKPRCVVFRFKTDLIETDSIVDSPVIRVQILLPQFPSISVTFEPLYKLNDYVLLVMSCIDTWLGFAVLDLNPVYLYRRFRRRRRTTRVTSANSDLRQKYMKLRCHFMLQSKNVDERLSVLETLCQVKSTAVKNEKR